jgi:hypothetical protein
MDLRARGRGRATSRARSASDSPPSGHRRSVLAAAAAGVAKSGRSPKVNSSAASLSAFGRTGCALSEVAPGSSRQSPTRRPRASAGAPRQTALPGSGCRRSLESGATTLSSRVHASGWDSRACKYAPSNRLERPSHRLLELSGQALVAADLCERVVASAVVQRHQLHPFGVWASGGGWSQRHSRVPATRRPNRSPDAAPRATSVAGPAAAGRTASRWDLRCARCAL